MPICKAEAASTVMVAGRQIVHPGIGIVGADDNESVVDTVRVFVNVTFAPGAMAPFGSTTVPRIKVVDCPRSVPPRTARQNSKMTRKKNRDAPSLAYIRLLIEDKFLPRLGLVPGRHPSAKVLQRKG